MAEEVKEWKSYWGKVKKGIREKVRMLTLEDLLEKVCHWRGLQNTIEARKIHRFEESLF